MLRRLAQRLRRAITTRSDLDDLYREVHVLRKRLIATEAMVVALAGAHPDRPALLERVRQWMDQPADAELSEYLRALKRESHDRVMSQWGTLLSNASAADSKAAATYH